jgi:RNA polymerase subunit RPABC4/transcription elongation factor Spt4
MKNCRSCHEAIPDNARFCPYCGKSVIEATVTCPSCGEENDLDMRHCQHCGFALLGQKQQQPPPPPKNDIFENTNSENTEQEIADRFSVAFERRLADEHAPKLHSEYIDRFYKSDFIKSVDFRIQQLAEEVRRLTGSQTALEAQKNALLKPALEELIDYFIVQYCGDLNEANFPEKILKYQGLAKEKVNLAQMALDYLDFDHEDESVYTDFVTMPSHKLKNAAQSFLKPKKGETIYFICDLSVLGSCKDGFSMTNECIYWKMPFEKAQRVYFKNLEEIKRQEDWITINGIFFNANKSLNLKIMRLLKKLRDWKE